MKNILIISSSLRRESNSLLMAEAFADGAQSANHNVEIVSLRDKHIDYCRGCMACMKTHRCLISDDMGELIDKMSNADVIVFASPVFYYNISGNLKTLLDRTLPLFDTPYRFKDIYLLTAGGDEPNGTPKHSEESIKGWVDCFPDTVLKDCMYATGVNMPRDILKSPILDECRNAGQRV